MNPLKEQVYLWLKVKIYSKSEICPRKGLFVQEHDFLSNIPSLDTFFYSAGRCPLPVQKSVNG